MGLVQFFRVLWARRLVTLLVMASCFLGTLVVTKLMPARYDARSRIMLDIVKPDPVTGEMLATGAVRAFVKTQVELIKDYRIAGKVVDDLGWTQSSVLANAYANRPASDKQDFRRWLAQRVIDNTDASLIDASNIMEIRYRSTSPDAAAKVADSVRQAYVDQALALRRNDAAKNAAWFRGQGERIRAELFAAAKRKADFERANGIIIQDDNVDTDTTRLTALASAAAAPTVTAGAPVAAAAGAPAVEQANAAIANAEKVLGPNNPDLIAMRRQRAALVAAAAASRPGAAGATVVSGPSLASQYSAQQAKVLSQRGKVVEGQQLANDVAVLRDQYTKTMARAAELEQQGESTSTGLTLLGNAVVPQSAAFPNWPLAIIGSLGLGLVLGILVSMIVELLRRRVRGIEDLQIENIPILGMMTKPQARARRTWRMRVPFVQSAHQGA